MKYFLISSFDEKELRKALRNRYPTPGWPSWRNATIAERTLTRAALLASSVAEIDGLPVTDSALVRTFLIELYAAKGFLFLVPPIAKLHPFDSTRERDVEAAMGLVHLMAELKMLEEVKDSLVSTVQAVERLMRN